MATTMRRTEAPAGEWPLERLQPNPLNPRRVEPDDPGIEELAESIRAVGLLQPIVITPDGRIIAGHRRAIACQRAGLSRAPVRVQDLDEAGQLAAMLAENLARRALNPLETAHACRGLADRGVAPDDIGKHCGLGRQTVLNHLAIVELPPVLQEKIARFEMPLGMAPHLVKLPSEAQRIALGIKAVNEGWTVPRLADHVTAALAVPLRRSAPAGTARLPAAPSRPPAPTGRALSRPLPAVSPGTTAGVLAALSDLTTAIRRQPALVRQPLVWEALERLGIAVREARG